MLQLCNSTPVIHRCLQKPKVLLESTEKNLIETMVHIVFEGLSTVCLANCDYLTVVTNKVHNIHDSEKML